jgi:hypothetical protein
MLVPMAAVVLGTLSVMQPNHFKTEKQLIARAQGEMQAGERLYFVDSRPFSARFYSQGNAGIVPRESVRDVLPQQGGRVLLAVEKGDLADIRDRIPGVIAPLYTSRRYVLLSISGVEKR